MIDYKGYSDAWLHEHYHQLRRQRDEALATLEHCTASLAALNAEFDRREARPAQDRTCHHE